MSHLPEFDPAQSYGMWGYSGSCCDQAMRRDNPDMLSECIDRGFVDIDTRMVNGTVLEWCEKRAPKCAELLKRRGAESRQIPAGRTGAQEAA